MDSGTGPGGEGRGRHRQRHRQRPRRRQRRHSPHAPAAAATGVPLLGAAQVLGPVVEVEGAQPQRCCAICFEGSALFAVAQCGHSDVCLLCAIKMRVFRRRKECPMCMQPSDSVIITDREEVDFQEAMSGAPVPNPPGGGEEEDVSAGEERNPSPSSPKRRRRLRYDATWDLYLDGDKAVQAIRLLRRPCCAVCGPDLGRMKNLSELKHHAREEHGLSFCEVCLRFRRVFFHEQELFTKDQLREHMREEHKYCRWCKQHFYSDDELYQHYRDKHLSCPVCERAQKFDSVFNNYADLEEHFRSKHFLCDHPLCLEARFIVFDTELNLELHKLTNHSQHLSQHARRMAIDRLLNSFESGGESASAEQRGGGRGGRRGGRSRGRGQGQGAAEVSNEGGDSRSPKRRQFTAEQQSLIEQLARNSNMTTEQLLGGSMAAMDEPIRPPPGVASLRDELDREMMDSDRVLPTGSWPELGTSEKGSSQAPAAKPPSWSQRAGSQSLRGIPGGGEWQRAGDRQSSSSQWSQLFSEEKIQKLPPDRRQRLQAPVSPRSKEESRKAERDRALAEALGIDPSLPQGFSRASQPALYSAQALEMAQSNPEFVDAVENQLIKMVKKQLRGADRPVTYDFPPQNERKVAVLMELLHVFNMVGEVQDAQISPSVRAYTKPNSVMPPLLLSQAAGLGDMVVSREDHAILEKECAVMVLPCNPFASADTAEYITMLQGSRGFTTSGRAPSILTEEKVRDLFSAVAGAFRIVTLSDKRKQEWDLRIPSQGFAVIFSSPEVKKQALRSPSLSNCDFFIQDCCAANLNAPSKRRKPVRRVVGSWEEEVVESTQDSWETTPLEDEAPSRGIMNRTLGSTSSKSSAAAASSSSSSNTNPRSSASGRVEAAWQGAAIPRKLGPPPSVSEQDNKFSVLAKW